MKSTIIHWFRLCTNKPTFLSAAAAANAVKHHAAHRNECDKEQIKNRYRSRNVKFKTLSVIKHASEFGPKNKPNRQINYFVYVFSGCTPRVHI